MRGGAESIGWFGMGGRSALWANVEDKKKRKNCQTRATPACSPASAISAAPRRRRLPLAPANAPAGGLDRAPTFGMLGDPTPSATFFGDFGFWSAVTRFAPKQGAPRRRRQRRGTCLRGGGQEEEGEKQDKKGAARRHAAAAWCRSRGEKKKLSKKPRLASRTSKGRERRGPAGLRKRAAAGARALRQPGRDEGRTSAPHGSAARFPPPRPPLPLERRAILSRLPSRHSPTPSSPSKS